MGISSESHGIKLLAWGIKKSPKIKQSVNSAAKDTAWVMANSPAKYIAQDLLKRSYNSYGWTERAEAWNKRGFLLKPTVDFFITPRSLHFKIERFKSLMQTI